MEKGVGSGAIEDCEEFVLLELEGFWVGDVSAEPNVVDVHVFLDRVLMGEGEGDFLEKEKPMGLDFLCSGMRRLLSIGMASIFLGGAVWGQEEAPAKLTDANLAKVQAYVVGDTVGAEYRKVAWKSNVLDGQREGSASDKPILLWLYFGGPLGNC